MSISWLSNTISVRIHSYKKIDQEFLYGYVYEPIERTGDSSFLHRFNHLSRAGLLQPIQDRHTMEELLTDGNDVFKKGPQVEIAVAKEEA
jgi:hypothetical protein